MLRLTRYKMRCAVPRSRSPTWHAVGVYFAEIARPMRESRPVRDDIRSGEQPPCSDEREDHGTIDFSAAWRLIYSEKTPAGPMSTVMRLLRSRLAGNALSLYALHGLNMLVPLIVLPLLLRTIGTRGYGTVMVALSLMGYALPVIDFGFNFTAARAISIARDDPAEVARIYWTTMAAKTVLLALSVAVIAIIVLATPQFRNDWPIFAAGSLLLVGNVAFPQWYLQGLERLKDAAIIQSVARVLSALAVVALVRGPADVWLAATLMAGPPLLGTLAAIVLRMPLAPGRFYRPARGEIAAALAESRHMFTANLTSALNLHTNTLVLGLMRGPESVAVFMLAARLVGFLQGLARPLTQAAYPRASLLFATHREKAWALLRRLAWLVLPPMALASLFLAAFAPALISFFGGPQFDEGIGLLRLMAAIPFVACITTLLAQTVMTNVGLAKELSHINLGIGLLNLALLPVLVHAWSASGAAVALLIAETLGPLLMAAVVRKRIRENAAAASSKGSEALAVNSDLRRGP